MGHYYDIDGNPHHFVDKKRGGGQRPTTIRDCRENGWLPSVTTVLAVLDKPGLNDWRVRQAVHAVVTAPDVPGESLDAKLTRILEVERQQDEVSQRAKDRGTEIHDTLEQLANGKSIEEIEEARKVLGLEKIGPWVMPAWEAISKQGKVEAAELVLVGDGYAGKTDLILRGEGFDIILDYKTTGKVPKDAWPEHLMQTAAYRCAWARDSQALGNIRRQICYISTTEPGRYLLYEATNHADDLYAFSQALHLWQYLNGYRPE